MNLLQECTLIGVVFKNQIAEERHHLNGQIRFRTCIQNPLPLVLQTGRNGKNDLFDLHLLCILLNLAGISHNRNTAKFGADLVGIVINDANRLVGRIVLIGRGMRMFDLSQQEPGGSSTAHNHGSLVLCIISAALNQFYKCLLKQHTKQANPQNGHDAM